MDEDFHLGLSIRFATHYVLTCAGLSTFNHRLSKGLGTDFYFFNAAKNKVVLTLFVYNFLNALKNGMKSTCTCSEACDDECDEYVMNEPSSIQMQKIHV